MVPGEIARVMIEAVERRRAELLMSKPPVGDQVDKQNRMAQLSELDVVIIMMRRIRAAMLNSESLT